MLRARALKLNKSHFEKTAPVFTTLLTRDPHPAQNKASLFSTALPTYARCSLLWLVSYKSTLPSPAGPIRLSPSIRILPFPPAETGDSLSISISQQIRTMSNQIHDRCRGWREADCLCTFTAWQGHDGWCSYCVVRKVI